MDDDRQGAPGQRAAGLLWLWRTELVSLLSQRATVVAFRELTAHAPDAGFAYDDATGCMVPTERLARYLGQG